YGSFFFFQAEDGIRDATVTGVQTCALPICAASVFRKAAFIRTQAHCHNGHVGDTAGLSMTPTPRRLLLQAAACTDATLRPRRGQIGRASCREGVSVSVEAGGVVEKSGS